jgi:SAM-dependent methyltransferase
MNTQLWNFGRRLLFPGLDIHTRARTALCRYWKAGPRRVLDAGCGNGYFAWLAAKYGARVDAVTVDGPGIAKARAFFAGCPAITFIHANLYDLDYPADTFDEIICYETIEHLMRDEYMLGRFAHFLKPGGALHLCAPNRLHPYHAVITPSPTEDGWHVRHGYDRESYARLLMTAGLAPVEYAGVGGRLVDWCDRVVRGVRNRAGDAAALPLFLAAWPLWPWARLTSPEEGFSVYVKAVKPAVPGEAPANGGPATEAAAVPSGK